MELQRGVCSLCGENTKVLTSPEAEGFIKSIPKLFYEQFPPETEFQNIKSLIKICGICCYKVEIAAEVKEQLTRRVNEENHVTLINECYFCNTDKNVLKIEKNWKFFTERTGCFLKSTNFTLGSCPRCLFYFDVMFSFKTKLLTKFPQLIPKRKYEKSQKANDTPKRKSFTSPSNSKKRKIFDNCFDYLQPLSNNKYYIKDEVKRDTRLYKGIAYVDLKNAKFFETPKVRPIIKIKLKPKGKKFEHESLKLTKSEEIPSKNIEEKQNSRRHSCIGVNEKLDETPKSAIVLNIVPKRRVSTYIDNGENDESPIEKLEEETKVELQDEGEKFKDTNGLEESTSIAENGGKEESNESATESSLSPVVEHNLTSSLIVEELNDSDTDRDKSKCNSEVDGLERKKKRVTFSDEMPETVA